MRYFVVFFTFDSWSRPAFEARAFIRNTSAKAAEEELRDAAECPLVISRTVEVTAEQYDTLMALRWE